MKFLPINGDLQKYAVLPINIFILKNKLSLVAKREIKSLYAKEYFLVHVYKIYMYTRLLISLVLSSLSSLKRGE